MALRQYDATGIDPDQKSFEPLPDGTYTLKITKTEETESKKGNLMAKVECEVINNPDYNGRKIFHNVTFLAPTEKGAGMAIHFLKTISQQWEGKIQIDIPSWVGAQFIAKLGQASYVSPKTGQKVDKNEIKAVEKDPNWIPF